MSPSALPIDDLFEGGDAVFDGVLDIEVGSHTLLTLIAQTTGVVGIGENRFEGFDEGVEIIWFK